MLYDKNVATFMLQLCYDKNSRQTLANHRPEACNFIKKETLAQVFSCEFCKISNNILFTEHLQTTASVNKRLQIKYQYQNGLNFSTEFQERLL